MIVILMGVSGSGKSTLGKALSTYTNWPFHDGDDYHPEANIKKMEAGTPLNDADRVPWLLKLRELIETALEGEDGGMVLACSALKRSYREVLGRDDPRIQFIYLKGSKELIAERLSKREGHFMPEDLLQSQFDALEEPTEEEALVFSIEENPRETLNAIMAHLQPPAGLQR